MEKRSVIRKPDSFHARYESYLTDQANLETRTIFNDRIFREKLSDLSYRILNHWEKNQLIDSERGEDGKGWRTYSLADMIWIQTIGELRKFGLPLDVIGTVKMQLQGTPKDKPSRFPLIEFYTAQFLIEKEPCYLLVFDDFVPDIGTGLEIDMAKANAPLANYVSISLDDIIYKVTQEKDLSGIKESKVFLTEKEMKVLDAVRDGKYGSIKIKKVNGELNLIEKTEYNLPSMVSDLLKTKDYDFIEINREDGVVVGMNRTLKEKL
ncbi:MAG: MerR family transcriptional regulator [Bacteroidetes bacterium]|nr:MerR family transcriptional regulator [Bacteroidota bacterium]MDA1120567.1 MerR family transcriptional regulator [Bacteroidota bacterium]